LEREFLFLSRNLNPLSLEMIYAKPGLNYPSDSGEVEYVKN
jgi:hypothetical protein